MHHRTHLVLPLSIASLLATASLASAEVLVNQQPPSNGGTLRWSQLWQDPGPDGNDLDGDAVCWQDFVLTEPKLINHLEWWGNGACELGFRIEIWKQDPGTIAYQPYAVFYYGGVDSAQPLVSFDTTAYTTSPGPGSLTHYTLDLANPIAVPANDATNPRWFIDIVGLTHVAYAPWNWAQGLGGSNKSYQFIRGSGPIFWVLPEGRAIVIGDATPPCPGDLNHDGSVGGADLAVLLGAWGGTGAADLNGDGVVNAADLAILLGAWGGC